MWASNIGYGVVVFVHAAKAFSTLQDLVARSSLMPSEDVPPAPALSSINNHLDSWWFTRSCVATATLTFNVRTSTSLFPLLDGLTALVDFNRGLHRMVACVGAMAKQSGSSDYLHRTDRSNHRCVDFPSTSCS